jgi:uncharacterized membrane protein
MKSIVNLLWVLVGILALVIVAIPVGAYYSPEFAAIAPTLATALIGPLVTVISGLGSAVASRTIKEAITQESQVQAEAQVKEAKNER